MKFNETQTKVEKDFYVLTIRGWTNRIDPKTRKSQSVAVNVFYKSSRYTPYSGCMQTTYDEDDAMKWKTAEGAAKARARLLAGKKLKPEHYPRVVRYTQTRSERLELIGEVALLDEV